MIEIAPLLEHKMDYDGAWLYCATLTYNNKYDWRIPTDDEFTYNEEIDEQSFDQSDDGRYRRQLHRPVNPVRTNND